MNWTVHQSITIYSLKVNSVSNSSVFQIGSTGSIRSHSELYNTGGFTGPAPEAEPSPLVPLPSITA